MKADGKKKRQEDAPAGSPAWMATFSDLMNLLLCFFVLLFSMSTVDAEKFQQIAASLASTFSVMPQGGSALIDQGVLISSGASQLNALSEYYNNVGLNTHGDTSEEVDDAYETLKKEGLAESEKMGEQIEEQLKDKNIADKVELTVTSEYVLLNLNGGVLFDSGKAEVKSDAISILDRVADSIWQYGRNTILIEGHTDNVPINTALYPNNMMLSLHRAYNVFDYFVSTKGYDKSTISSSGRGEAVPVATNDTPEGRAQNRRVEIKIYNSLYSQNNK